MGIPRRALLAAGALMLVVLAGLATWYGVRASRVRWARNVALPEIARLVEKEHPLAAFRLAQRVERYVTADPVLERLKQNPL